MVVVGEKVVTPNLFLKFFGLLPTIYWKICGLSHGHDWLVQLAMIWDEQLLFVQGFVWKALTGFAQIEFSTS
jgi:hypothetical protein